MNDIVSHTFNLGVTTVTYTVTDALGLSAECSFTVTVEDNTRPTAICQNISVTLDINTGTVSVTEADINNGSFDNCGIASIEAAATFDCTNLGPNNVVLTVTDNAGNTGTCTAIVTVNYAVVPDPLATPQTDVVCDDEATSIVLTNNIPGTTWTWTVSSSSEITGASADQSGLLSAISQTLSNSDTLAHYITYSITPRVYGTCNLPAITADAWVNPIPEIPSQPG